MIKKNPIIMLKEIVKLIHKQEWLNLKAQDYQAPELSHAGGSREIFFVSCVLVGVLGHFDEELVIPIIENEREDYLLVDRMREAIEVSIALTKLFSLEG